MLTRQEIQEKLQAVIDKLIHLGGADYEMDKKTDTKSQYLGLVARDFGFEEWDWPQGIGLYGLYKVEGLYGDGRYQDFFKEWYGKNFSQGLPSRNVNTTAPFLTLAFLAEEWGDKRYQEECRKRAEWVMELLPKTKENGFQHVTSAIGDRQAVRLNDGELWIDTLVMTVLFLNHMGQSECRSDYREEALHQFLLHIKYLYHKESGLFFHGWSFLRNDNFGGVFWCRGNSWFTFGVLEYIEQCGASMQAGIRKYLVEVFLAQVKALLDLQDDSGLWHTVLNESDSYLEVSGSAAIAAGIYKGIHMGILPEEYRKFADRAVEAICENIAEDGTVLNVSAGTAIGMDSDYYKNVMIKPMAYGQSLVIIALSEALRQYTEYGKEKVL